MKVLPNVYSICAWPVSPDRVAPKSIAGKYMAFDPFDADSIVYKYYNFYKIFHILYYIYNYYFRIVFFGRCWHSNFLFYINPTISTTYFSARLKFYFEYTPRKTTGHLLRTFHINYNTIYDIRNQNR